MGKKNKKAPRFSAQLSMAGTQATLTVAGCIGWDTEAVEFTDKVKAAKESGATLLVVRINSLGGYCYDGLAMGDCLKNCGMETRGEVYGTAQSMASYLLQCCDVRTAHENATLMFHQPSAGVYGTVDELLTQAQHLVAMRDKMFADMAARCGTTGEALSAEHMSMKIYTAAEALAKGFLDSIEGGADEAPVEPEETPEQAQAHGVMEYGRVLRMAMSGEDPEEETEEETTEEETEETPEETPEETEPKETEETEPEETEPEETEKTEPEETEPEETKEETEEDKPVSRAEVARMIAAATMEAVAAMGAPADSLPGMHGGVTGGATKEPTMEELDEMPAMRRMVVLSTNPVLAEKYARH